MTGTLFIFIATFLWALDTLIRYPLLNLGISSVEIVFIEHLFLVLIMFALSKTLGKSFWPFKKKDWPALVVIGGLGSAIGTLAFTQAFSLMNPTLVIVLQKLQPIVAISLAGWILKEKIPKLFYVYLVLCLLGSLLIIGSDLLDLGQTQGWFYRAETQYKLIGYGLTLLAVVSWGASTVFGKKLMSKGYSATQLMNGRFSMGLLFLIPVLAFVHQPLQNIEPVSYGKILLMVCISGLLGMAIYYRGLKLVKSHQSALAEMFFPVAAGVINWVVLGLSLTLWQIVGALLLIVASMSVHLRFKS